MTWVIEMRWVLKCDNQYLVLTESYKVWLEDLYFLAETLLSAQLGHNVFVNKKNNNNKRIYILLFNKMFNTFMAQTTNDI